MWLLIDFSSTRTSHPVGTTVRITDFLKYIPVRRQTSLNVSSKTLTKLKRLVQAYAFAQLSRRFLLKVLKPKNESNNWMYAPSTESTLADASLKIAGRDVATCCILKECSSDCPQDADGGKQNKYELVALLPNEVPGIFPLQLLSWPFPDCYRYSQGEQRGSVC